MVEARCERKRGRFAFLALESGDVVEGFLPEEIEEMGWKDDFHIKVEGICSNFYCLSGVLPDEEILERL